MTVYNENSALPFLANLDNWQFKNNAIEKHWVFKNFPEALAFIVKVGVESEKVNHHPEIFNVYNKVTLRLSTHDSGGVTNKDFALAKKIDELL